MCNVSRVTCHMSGVTCHVSHVKKKKNRTKWWSQGSVINGGPTPSSFKEYSWIVCPLDDRFKYESHRLLLDMPSFCFSYLLLLINPGGAGASLQRADWLSDNCCSSNILKTLPCQNCLSWNVKLCHIVSQLVHTSYIQFCHGPHRYYRWQVGLGHGVTLK